MTHFSVVVNFATTGHKLQGKTLKALFIAQWSTVAGWAYVVLSRVKSISKLFLHEPIPEEISFLPNKKVVEMMEKLRGMFPPTSVQFEDVQLIDSDVINR
jgi:hypothetical protein